MCYDATVLHVTLTIYHPAAASGISPLEADKCLYQMQNSLTNIKQVINANLIKSTSLGFTFYTYNSAYENFCNV